MSTATAEDIAAAGIEITHHFAGGLYAKEMRVPAGVKIGKHVHDFDHFSVLLVGAVSLDLDGEKSKINAPALLTIKSGQQHVITALTDVVWHCIHATPETDPDKVDLALTGDAA